METFSLYLIRSLKIHTHTQSWIQLPATISVYIKNPSYTFNEVFRISDVFLVGYENNYSFTVRYNQIGLHLYFFVLHFIAKQNETNYKNKNFMETVFYDYK